MESNRVGMRITTRLVREKYLTSRNGLILSLDSSAVRIESALVFS
jgi:hypothetical protein